jgi:LemA protein
LSGLRQHALFFCESVEKEGDMEWFTVLVGVLLLALFYGVSLYNNLVAANNAVSKAWVHIDVLLKQRHDELLQLVKACKQCQQFERSALQSVMEARAAVLAAAESRDAGALGSAEVVLRAWVGRIIALAQAYPVLMADQSFLAVLGRISALEGGIAQRRALYNDAVSLNNVLLESFPDNAIASRFKFGKKQLLEFSSVLPEDMVSTPEFDGR